MNKDKLSLLKNIILNSKPKKVAQSPAKSIIDIKLNTAKLQKANEKKPNPKVYVPLEDYNKSINSLYQYPTISQLNKGSHFFNSKSPKLEWSTPLIEDISRIVEKSKKSKIPEVLFLGRSNSGKSTLLNNLITNLKQNELDAIARASKKTGFTKTLNCFEYKNKLKLIDTPGYGQNSKISQGELVITYLQSQKFLRKVFLLNSAEKKLNQWDYDLIDFLANNGIPYDIVYTKVDKIKNIEQFYTDLKNLHLNDLPMSPRIILTNSKITKYFIKRYGIAYLRYVILESCGIN